MPRIRRRFLLDPAEIGVCHCIWLQLMARFNRLFRRAAAVAATRTRRARLPAEVSDGLTYLLAETTVWHSGR